MRYIRMMTNPRADYQKYSPPSIIGNEKILSIINLDLE